MTREEAAHVVDIAFGVPQAVRRVGEDRTYHEDEIREAKEMAIDALKAEPCEDCISRQAVIDKAIYTETEEGWSGMTVDVKDIERLPSVKPQLKTGHWIPVSEKLPEEDGQYLITVKYKHVNDNYEDIYTEHGEWFEGRWDMFCFAHCGEVEDIIAWMPLPTPYEPQESEEKKCR